MKNTGKVTIAAAIAGGLVAGISALAGVFSEKSEQEKTAKARLEENTGKEENEVEMVETQPETYIDIADKVETEDGE